jgi:type I restriction enzyme S subunit
MSGEYQTVRLGELCRFSGGAGFPQHRQGAASGEYPFIKVSDMELPGNAFRITRANNWVDEATRCELKAKAHPPNSTVFAKIGVALTYNRRRLLTRPTIVDNNMMAAIPDEKRVDPLFFYYLLKQTDFNEVVAGTALPYINASDLAKMEVGIPPLAEQKAIAAVLGALDDKIEVNRRMNATLEAMARALFQSWFVDFDPIRAKLDGRKPVGLDSATAALFPSAFQESGLGPIPREWTAQRLPDAIEVNPRRTLKAGTIAPYLDMKNLPTQGHSAEEVVDREFSSGTKFLNGDTLLARITPCLENGKTGYVDFLEDGQVGWGSTEYIVFAPKPPLPPQYGYLLARSDALRSHAIQNMTGTSGRQRVPSECFNTFWLAVPPPAIARRFDELTVPLMAKIKANSTESRTLATLRDTLLPKLLSGELSVGVFKA